MKQDSEAQESKECECEEVMAYEHEDELYVVCRKCNTVYPIDDWSDQHKLHIKLRDQ